VIGTGQLRQRVLERRGPRRRPRRRYCVAIAERKGVTRSQLALAWVLAQARTSSRPRAPGGSPTCSRTSPQWTSRSVVKTSPPSTRSRWPGSPPVGAKRLVACRPSTAEPLTARPNIQSTRAIFVGHRISKGRPRLTGRQIVARQIVAAARAVSAQRFRRRHGVRPGDRSASPRCRLR
jgi:hypothetical protein